MRRREAVDAHDLGAEFGGLVECGAAHRTQPDDNNVRSNCHCRHDATRHGSGRKIGNYVRNCFGQLHMTIRQVSSRVVYRNRWMTVREDEIERDNGSRGIYGVVEKFDGAIVHCHRTATRSTWSSSIAMPSA